MSRREQTIQQCIRQGLRHETAAYVTTRADHPIDRISLKFVKSRSNDCRMRRVSRIFEHLVFQECRIISIRLNLSGKGEAASLVETLCGRVVTGDHQAQFRGSEVVRPPFHRLHEHSSESDPALRGSHPHRRDVHPPRILFVEITGDDSAGHALVHGYVADGSTAIPGVHSLEPVTVGESRLLCVGASESSGSILESTQTDGFKFFHEFQ